MTITHADRLAEAPQKHADLASALEAWARTVHDARWHSLRDLRETYAHADAVKLDAGRTVVVFNVRGNSYRLVAAVDYGLQVVNVLKVMTHAEYSKEKWKVTI